MQSAKSHNLNPNTGAYQRFWYTAGGRTADNLGAGAHVWAICDRYHIYQCRGQDLSKPKHRCPVCAGRTIVAGVNDFTTVHPHLAKQLLWHLGEPGDHSYHVGPDSEALAVWVCDNGHQYCASYRDVVADGHACRCATRRYKLIEGFNDLTSYDKIADDWDEARNRRRPERVRADSDKPGWWRCRRYEHSYRMSPRERIAIEDSDTNPCPQCRALAHDQGDTAGGTNSIAAQ